MLKLIFCPCLKRKWVQKTSWAKPHGWRKLCGLKGRHRQSGVWVQLLIPWVASCLALGHFLPSLHWLFLLCTTKVVLLPHCVVVGVAWDDTCDVLRVWYSLKAYVDLGISTEGGEWLGFHSYIHFFVCLFKTNHIHATHTTNTYSVVLTCKTPAKDSVPFSGISWGGEGRGCLIINVHQLIGVHIWWQLCLISNINQNTRKPSIWVIKILI